MKNCIRLFTALFLTLSMFGSFVVTAAQARAEDKAHIAALVETLSTLNRNQPLQSPLYQADSRILGRSIVDQKNKVVGQVQDVILDEFGAMEALEINFNRMRLGTAYLNYRDMRFTPITQGYRLGLDEPQIRSVFSDFSKNMPDQTARGGLVFRLKRLNGAPVKLENNNALGKVVTVLFNRNGTRAENLYMEIKHKIGWPSTLAVPYHSVEYRVDAVGNVEVFLSAQLERAIIDYLNAR